MAPQSGAALHLRGFSLSHAMHKPPQEEPAAAARAAAKGPGLRVPEGPKRSAIQREQDRLRHNRAMLAVTLAQQQNAGKKAAAGQQAAAEKQAVQGRTSIKV